MISNTFVKCLESTITLSKVSIHGDIFLCFKYNCGKKLFKCRGIDANVLIIPKTI